MNNRKIILIISAIVIVVAGATYWYTKDNGRKEQEQTFCTMEALLCPDGSGVGRQGSQCAFSACSGNSFTGELAKDSMGYRLWLPSPVGGGVSSAIYVMPLLVENESMMSGFLGKRITVKGEFTEGNTFKVSSFMEASASEGGSDAHEGTISVGETKLISGVKITVNSIVSDSRCPSGVQCIQAGWVAASVTLKSDTDKETIEMRSGTAPKAFDSFKVSLIKIEPQKTSAREIPAQEYQLTFRVDAL